VQVLHVLEAVRGGTSRHVADIVGSAPAVTHHVALPPPDSVAAGSGADYDRGAVARMAEQGAVLHHVAMRRSVTHPTNLVAVVRLRSLVETLRPDVLHGHSSIGGALSRVVAASTGRPSVYTPNGIAVGAFPRLVEASLTRTTSAFVAVSPSEEQVARTLGAGRHCPLHTIPNGIELRADTGNAPDLRSELGVPVEAPLIGTVARLVAQKAPEDFVAICRAVLGRRPDTHAVLIGQGPLQPVVDELLADQPRFHQIPRMPDASRVLGQLQVFILPSRFEGAPYTPLEAMRARTPVVLSDVVGNRDAVEPGRTGVLVPFGDTEAAAAAVIALLDDPEHRTAMAEAAYHRLRDHFDVVVMGRRLTELYRSLLAVSSKCNGVPSTGRRCPS
jgi:glycosyltransferase involved in cell wall biosynthesis